MDKRQHISTPPCDSGWKSWALPLCMALSPWPWLHAATSSCAQPSSLHSVEFNCAKTFHISSSGPQIALIDARCSPFWKGKNTPKSMSPNLLPCLVQSLQTFSVEISIPVHTTPGRYYCQTVCPYQHVEG